MAEYEGARVKREADQASFMEELRKGHSRREASMLTGIPYSTVNYWLSEYPDFATEVRGVEQVIKSRRARTDQIVVDPNKPMPIKPDFTTWRRMYLGRAVETHQEPLVRALEDRTNSKIICLMPPGSGKDTTAGDWLLYELCDDRTGMRNAWLMEADDFARRRLTRLQAYLTDRRVYDHIPEGRTSTKPTANLIDDYGPFRWEKNMVYPDGTKVERPTWTQNKVYLLQNQAPEADPNLWTSGLGGTIYGSRMSQLVISDAFTRENQKSPVMRAEQMDFIKGTLRTRFDGRGRFICIGTRTGPDHTCNYVALINYFTANSRIIHTEPFYTKYANGTAVIIHPAILYDDDGNEKSYWEEKFPLRTVLELPTGAWIELDSLTDDEQLEFVDQPGIAIIDGLKDIQSDDVEMFETLHQQNPPSSVSGEFTDDILNHCDDGDRTLGVYDPAETLVLGVDPARTGGAAWVLWGANRTENTLTVIDFFYGERLGIPGIASKLIVDPISKYMPEELAYEINHEYGVLFLPEVRDIIRSTLVKLQEHKTGDNRHTGEASVASMSIQMRNGTIRFPAQTVLDRQRMALLKQHFKNWDAATATQRTRGGQWRHEPDDVCMAAWIGWVYAKRRLEKRRLFGRNKTRVPAVTAARWTHSAAAPETPARDYDYGKDAISSFFGDA